jgi:acetolactate synthase-1/2/3 large subunit
MYTLQARWTMAREGLHVITLLFNNRSYEILKTEFKAMGAGEPGQKALDMLEIGRPDIDWVSLSRGQAVPAVRVETLDALARELRIALGEQGPRLIDVII